MRGSVASWSATLYVVVLFFTLTPGLPIPRWCRWVVLILFALATVCMKRAKHLAMPAPHLFPVVVIYFGLSMASMLAAHSQLLSLSRWSAFWLLVGPCLLVWRTRLTTADAQAMLARLQWILVGGTIVLLLLPTPRSIHDDPRFYRGAAGDPNTMGHCCAMSIVLLFCWCQAQPLGLRRHLGAGIIVLLGSVLFASHSRSAMVALLAGLCLFAHYYPWWRARLYCLTATAIILVLGCDLGAPVCQYAVKHDASGQTSRTLVDLLHDTMATRWCHWTRAYGAFAERPILGWGFGSSRDSPGHWTFKFDAIGAVPETNNDLLALMETGGVLCLFGHLILLTMVFTIPVSVRARTAGSLVKAKVLLCTLATLFLLDSTSLAPGYLCGAVFWLAAALAASPALNQYRASSGLPATDRQEKTVARGSKERLRSLPRS